MNFGLMASITALAVVIIISLIREEANIGLLSISFAVLIGGIFLNLPGNEILKLFPVDKFMLFLGITYLYNAAYVTGAITRLSDSIIKYWHGNLNAIIIVIYLLTNLLTTLGIGNVKAVIIIAPLAMELARQMDMSPFLMILLIGGAANSASFSPLAPAGIISHELIAGIAHQIPSAVQFNFQSLAWKMYWVSQLVQGIIYLVSFLFLGGWDWFSQSRHYTLQHNLSVEINEPLNPEQRYSLIILGLYAFLVLILSSPGFKVFFPTWLKGLAESPGSLAFILGALLTFLISGQAEKALNTMPWGVIIMVCGAGTLLSVMERAGGLAGLVQVINRIAGPWSITGWLGLLAGIISVYSSSTEVVLPLLLSMVPGYLNNLGLTNPAALIYTININSHLVDISPLSILGAVCIACARGAEKKEILFRSLLIWSICVSAIGPLFSWLLFGIINL